MQGRAQRYVGRAQRCGSNCRYVFPRVKLEQITRSDNNLSDDMLEGVELSKRQDVLLLWKPKSFFAVSLRGRGSWCDQLPKKVNYLIPLTCLRLIRTFPVGARQRVCRFAVINYLSSHSYAWLPCELFPAVMLSRPAHVPFDGKHVFDSDQLLWGAVEHIPR